MPTFKKKIIGQPYDQLCFMLQNVGGLENKCAQDKYSQNENVKMDAW